MARDAGTSFKDVRKSLYTELMAHACVPEVEIDGVVTKDTDKRFFPAGTAEKVLTSGALERLFTTICSTREVRALQLRPFQLGQQVNDRKLHGFLAILITSNCDADVFAGVTTSLLAPRPWTSSEIELVKLPVENGNSLRAIFGDDVAVDNFLQKQHEFCAPIIEKGKEIRGQFRRVPYVKEKLIGQGSFGKIYDVYISPHHFKGGQMSNDQAYRLARKDFELNAEDKAHEKERDVLREIVRNAKRHTNIMKSLGSLENGSIYSIFMPLADCDLKQYMERHPPPASPMQKASFVQCAVGLAGAIVYLHEELESPVYEKLSCFHMDLKPQNILVVINPETEQHSWKLSDFNMSRVKMKRNPAADHLTLRRSSTFGDNVYEVNKLFKRRIPDAAARSVTDYTINRRGTGTYLAPEACVEGHPVQAESDIWSLGCVISVVFSYLYGGQAAVEEYSQLRGKNDVDSFFAFSNGKSAHKLSDAQVSDAVKKWHRHLRMRIKQERPDESHIFEAVINFLDRKVLIVDPKHRRETTANDVRLKLIEAFNLFRTIADQPPISPSSPGHRFSIPFFGKRSKRRQSEIEAQSQEWKIPLPAPVQACAFGPNAEPLVCMTDRTLSIFSFEHVLLSLDSGHLDNNMIEYGQASPEHKWRNWIPIIGVSSRYILAATNHHDFDCYFYHIPQPGSHNTEIELVAHWQLKMPKIWRLAISPDARYAAFVLFSAFSQDRNAMLYVTRLDWLQGADSESRFLSIVSSSSGSSATPSSPLGRPIELPCAAEDICELTFSEINGLYIVAKPKQSDTMTANTMHVFAWSLHDGERVAMAPSPIKHDGRDDILQGLYTSFAPYNKEMAFAIVSQEKRVIIRAWELDRYTQSNARGHRLLRILLDQDDREVLAFGTREAHNELQLLTFAATDTKDEVKIQSRRSLMGMTHQTKFVPAINTTTTGPLSQHQLLIAVLENSRVRILRIALNS